MFAFLASAAAVSGTIGDQEQFRGTLTASSFVITTISGAQCRAGRKFRVINNEASGLLWCDDGRLGDFVVSIGFTDGDGTGHVGKEWLRFTVEGWRTCPRIQNPLFPDKSCDR